MTSSLIFLFILTALTVTRAWSGDYADLKKEFDEYQPPSYVTVQGKSGPQDKPSSADIAFDSEKKRLMEIKKKWEKALMADGGGPRFFVPSPKVLKLLQPARSDARAAGVALGDEFSLETLETLALLRNPGVRAAESRFRASVETFSQVLDLDAILRQYNAFTEDLMTGVGPVRGKDSVKTKFPFPGVLALKGEIVGQAVKAAREDLEMARRDAVTAARVTYWKLLFVQKARKITKETVGLLEQLEKVAGARYEAGKTSFQDVIKVRIEREILQEELITLFEKQRNWESKIREIVDLPPGVKIGLPEKRQPIKRIPSIASLYPLARDRRQELRRLRAMVGKMERMIEMAETAILPLYTLGLSFYEDDAVSQVGSQRTREPFPVSTRASTGAGLPKMPWYGSDDAYLRQTRQSLRALKEDLQKAEDETMTLVRNGWFNLDRAKREEALYRGSLVELSRAVVDVSTRGYESGRVSFADVISSYTIWLEMNLAAEKKLSGIGIAWAELEKTLGRSFGQKNSGVKNG